MDNKRKILPVFFDGSCDNKSQEPVRQGSLPPFYKTKYVRDFKKRKLMHDNPHTSSVNNDYEDLVGGLPNEMWKIIFGFSDDPTKFVLKHVCFGFYIAMKPFNNRFRLAQLSIYFAMEGYNNLVFWINREITSKRPDFEPFLPGILYKQMAIAIMNNDIDLMVIVANYCVADRLSKVTFSYPVIPFKTCDTFYMYALYYGSYDAALWLYENEVRWVSPKSFWECYHTACSNIYRTVARESENKRDLFNCIMPLKTQNNYEEAYEWGTSLDIPIANFATKHPNVNKRPQKSMVEWFLKNISPMSIHALEIIAETGNVFYDIERVQSIVTQFISRGKSDSMKVLEMVIGKGKKTRLCDSKDEDTSILKFLQSFSNFINTDVSIKFIQRAAHRKLKKVVSFFATKNHFVQNGLLDILAKHFDEDELYYFLKKSRIDFCRYRIFDVVEKLVTYGFAKTLDKFTKDVITIQGPKEFRNTTLLKPYFRIAASEGKCDVLKVLVNLRGKRCYDSDGSISNEASRSLDLETMIYVQEELGGGMDYDEIFMKLQNMGRDDKFIPLVKWASTNHRGYPDDVIRECSNVLIKYGLFETYKTIYDDTDNIEIPDDLVEDLVLFDEFAHIPWAVKRGATFYPDSMNSLINHEKWDVIKELITSCGVKWSSASYLLLAHSGNLEMLKWAEANGCPFPTSDEDIDKAVNSEDISFFSISSFWICYEVIAKYKVLYYATNKGKLDVFKYVISTRLLNEGLPIISEEIVALFRFCIGQEFLEIANYIIDFHCPSDSSMCAAAALSGNLNLLKRLKQLDVPWDEKVCEGAVNNRHPDVLRWARKYGAPWSRGTAAMAVELGFV